MRTTRGSLVLSSGKPLFRIWTKVVVSAKVARLGTDVPTSCIPWSSTVCQFSDVYENNHNKEYVSRGNGNGDSKDDVWDGDYNECVLVDPIERADNVVDVLLYSTYERRGSLAKNKGLLSPTECFGMSRVTC